VGAWFAREARVGIGFSGWRAKDENWTWIFPTAERDRVRAQLAEWREIDTAELERRRIAAGIPAVSADIGPADLPGEGGLEAVAISYTKGCYLGQEVMARLKSMGQVRRRLRRVRGPGGVPKVPLPLWQEGRQVGELRSVVATADGFAGMAMLSLINLRAELPLALEVAGSAEITLLPEEP
jgi:folate-binding protein YgfZ